MTHSAAVPTATAPALSSSTATSQVPEALVVAPSPHPTTGSNSEGGEGFPMNAHSTRSSGASQPSSASLSSSSNATSISISVVVVLSTDRHEYALPFTLAPSALCHHPTQPLYARAGPEGMVAVMSLSLEPVVTSAVAQSSPAAVYQYVHRLVTVLSYAPLPGLHAHNVSSASAAVNGASKTPFASDVTLASSSSGGSIGANSGGGLAASMRRGSGLFRSSGLLSGLTGTSASAVTGGSGSNLVGGSSPGMPQSSSSAVSGSSASSSGGIPRSISGIALARMANAITGSDVKSIPPGPPKRVNVVYNLDEQVTRLRWTPDGNGVAACFASGVVRLWDLSPGNASGHKRPSHVLSTSGSHAIAAAGAGNSDSNAAAGRPVWSATDVAFLNYGGTIVAVSAAPLLPDSRPAPAPTAPSSSVDWSASDSTHPLSSGARTPSMGPPSPSMAELLYSGWGLHLFDTRSGDAPVALAARYPSFPGVTSLLYDEASLTVLAGCEDGGLLSYDVRAYRILTRIPGVPMVALQQGTKPRAHDRKGAGSAAASQPGSLLTPIATDGANAALGGLTHSVTNSASSAPDSPRVGFPLGGRTASEDSLARSDATADVTDNATEVTAAAAEANARSLLSCNDGHGPVPASDVSFGHAGSVHVMSLHPSRRLMATAGHDGDVTLWSLPCLARSSTIRGLHTARPHDFGRQHQQHHKSHHHHHSSYHQPPQHQQQGTGILPSLPSRGSLTTQSSGTLDGAGSLPSSAASAVPAAPSPFVGIAGDASLVAPSAGASTSPSSVSMSSDWAIAAGVSALVLTEDHIVSAGYDGAVVAVPQVW